MLAGRSELRELSVAENISNLLSSQVAPLLSQETEDLEKLNLLIYFSLFHKTEGDQIAKKCK
jgi:hypothetical protein